MLKTIQGAVLMRNCCEDDRQVLFLNECVSFPYFLDLHNFFFQCKKIKSLSFDAMDSMIELLKKEYLKDIDPVFMYSYTDILLEGTDDCIYILEMHRQKYDFAFIYEDNENKFYLSYAIQNMN